MGFGSTTKLLEQRVLKYRGMRVCEAAVQVQPYGSVGLLAMLSVGRLRASAALHASASSLELHYQLLTQQPARGQPCEVLPNWEQQEPNAPGRPLSVCIPPMPLPG